MPTGSDSRSHRARDSPDSIRPYTPPNLSSIPNMDGTPSQPVGASNVSGSNNPDSSGPYIIGSPIDLGEIDNVDNIGSRMQDFTPAWAGKRINDHIELKETGTAAMGDAGKSIP